MLSAARCRVPGCRRKPHARGLCQKHYDEQRKKRTSERSRARTSQRSSAARKSRKSSGRLPAAAAGADEDIASKMCSVPGCASPHHAKGYCKMHYGQLRRRGRIEELPGAAAEATPLLSRDQRLVEIKKRHELLKREIASIHKALASEPDDDDDDDD
jgi:hypothetical protein